MAKDGLVKQVVPHKRVLNNNTKPEVDNLRHNLKQAEEPVKELELLPPSNKADPKLVIEEPLQTQGTQLETTSLEVELLLNKSKPKIQILLP